MFKKDNMHFVKALIKENEENPTGPFERFIGSLKPFIKSGCNSVVIYPSIPLVEISIDTGSYRLTDYTCRAVKGQGEAKYAPIIEEEWTSYLSEHFGNSYDEAGKKTSKMFGVCRDKKVDGYLSKKDEHIKSDENQ